MNARELLAVAAGQLARAGVGSPRVDAELLLAHALGIERSRLLLAAPADSAAIHQFEALVRRRIAREPLQYLLGTAAFRHLLLAVGPGVFIPRPETELLVDAVLPFLQALHQPVVVDLCSGSGALALAVATEVPAAHVVAVERSPRALVWLERNVERCAVRDRVQVVAADVRSTDLLDEWRGAVDVVLCNPPYVPTDVAVDPEVAQDPVEAVFAGADGLDLMPAVLARAAELLRPGGRLVVEHDDTHGAEMPAGLSGAGTSGWTDVLDHPDLNGRPRYVTATRV